MLIKSQTPFSAPQHGFGCVNSFKFPLSFQYTLPILGQIDLKDVVYGLCGGMCFAALDYYHAGQRLPSYERPEDIDRALHTYLAGRQLDSLQISILLKLVDWLLVDPAKIAARMARSELPRVTKMIDRGEPAVLLLLRVQGLGAATLNHQVLATAYETNPDQGEITFTLYDPNHPCEEPTITVRLPGPGRSFSISQSTHEPLLGFFVVPYRAQKTLPQIARPGQESFALPAFKLHWPVDSQRVNQYFGENPASYKAFGFSGHEGLDLYATSGANIYAAADGEVYQAGFPSNHPYGLHVRIRHELGGRTCHTIYGHLQEVFVQPGQRVSAGERIGLADNSGNSLGSHLHLTLKIDGETTPGYPPGVVDPWPFLQNSAGEPSLRVMDATHPVDAPVPLPDSGITVYTTAELNLRRGPGTDTPILGRLPSGEALRVLGSAAKIEAQIGKEGEWLQVRAAGGKVGYVAAEFVQDGRQALLPGGLVVYPFEALNLRSGPGTGFELVASLNQNDSLVVLGDEGSARERIGKKNSWLAVQTAAGQRGFVAAWLVHLTGQTPPPTGLTVYPTGVLNVRSRPAVDAHILTVAAPGEALAVLGDKDAEAARIGCPDQWLSVRTPGRFTGYVAAWLVQSESPAPQPQPAPVGLTVFAAEDLNLRAQPSVNSPRIGGLLKGQAFQVMETDLEAAKRKIGQEGTWVNGRLPGGVSGWAAAWFLKLDR